MFIIVLSEPYSKPRTSNNKRHPFNFFQSLSDYNSRAAFGATPRLLYASLLAFEELRHYLQSHIQFGSELSHVVRKQYLYYGFKGSISRHSIAATYIFRVICLSLAYKN